MGKLDHSKEIPFQTPPATLQFGNTDAETSSGIDLCNEGISSGYVWGNIFWQYLLWPTDAKPKAVSPQNDSHLYMRQHTEIAQRSADCIVRCPTAYWLLFSSSSLRNEFPQCKHKPAKLKHCMSCRMAAIISFHLRHLIDFATRDTHTKSMWKEAGGTHERHIKIYHRDATIGKCKFNLKYMHHFPVIFV